MANDDDEKRMTRNQLAEHGYHITAAGRIFKRDPCDRRVMRPLFVEVDNHGYPSTRITIGGRRRRHRVHVIVAWWFHGKMPKPGMLIRHLDGDRLNSRPCNLAYGTAKENAADRDAHGRTHRKVTR